MAKLLNPGAHYFDSSDAVYNILWKVVRAINEGTTPSIRNADIEKARGEVLEKMVELDKAAQPIADYFADYLFGKISRRKVLVVMQGDFIGSGEEIRKSKIGIDITKDSHLLYARTKSGETVDSKVSDMMAERYLRENRAELRKKGFHSFKLYSSSFFQFSEGDLDFFMNGKGEINMAKLLPFITETNDYVGVNPINIPDEILYHAHPLEFVDHRLKVSIKDKILRRLKGTDKVADWLGHEMVVAGRDTVDTVKGDFYADGNRFGMPMEVIKVEDYYQAPKRNGYRDFNAVVRISVPRYPSVISEIQVLDLGQRYKNKINPKDPANRVSYERSKSVNYVSDSVRINALVLDRLFGVEFKEFPILNLSGSR